MLLVIFLAGYLRDKRELLAIPTRRFLGMPVPPFAVLGPMLVVMGTCLAVLGLLNDFGTPLLYFGVFVAMLYVASGRGAYVAAGLGLFAVGAVGVWARHPARADARRYLAASVLGRAGPGISRSSSRCMRSPMPA